MDNVYDYITCRPNEFSQLAANDLLFLHYKCPQEARYVYVYNHFNQIAFTLQGTKTFHLGSRTWRMTEESSHFAKKGAWKQENADLQWELLYNILANPENTDFLAYVRYLSNFQKPSLKDIMEANFYYNLSIAEFARISQRSVSSFKRDFEVLYHTTPGKWLTDKRLSYAKHFVETSTKNINEIVYDSGFENVSHFSRVFKEKFGMAPLQYRKQMKMVEQ